MGTGRGSEYPWYRVKFWSKYPVPGKRHAQFQTLTIFLLDIPENLSNIPYLINVPHENSVSRNIFTLASITISYPKNLIRPQNRVVQGNVFLSCYVKCPLRGSLPYWKQKLWY